MILFLQKMPGNQGSCHKLTLQHSLSRVLCVHDYIAVGVVSIAVGKNNICTFPVLLQHSLMWMMTPMNHSI